MSLPTLLALLKIRSRLKGFEFKKSFLWIKIKQQLRVQI